MVGHNAVTDRRTIRAPSLPSAAATTLRLQRTNSTSNIETPRDLPILKRAQLLVRARTATFSEESIKIIDVKV